MARILKPDGVALTSWFFFDRDAFLSLLRAVLFVLRPRTIPAKRCYRRWFIETYRILVFGVGYNASPYFQAPMVRQPYAEPRLGGSVPPGEEAEWLCGATLRPIAKSTLSGDAIQRGSNSSPPKVRPMATAAAIPVQRQQWR